MLLAACGADDGMVVAELLAFARGPGIPEAPVAAPSPSPAPSYPGTAPAVEPTPPLEEPQAPAPEAEPTPAPIGDLESEALRILDTYCADCHGPNGFPVLPLDDVQALVDVGLLIPGSPADSPIFARIESGTMPPLAITPRPTPAEVQTLSEFILELDDR